MASDASAQSADAGSLVVGRVPPHAFFLVSAVFHYLGPSFAVLLFTQLAPPGVAWLRIASAGLIFAAWRRPWRVLVMLPRRDRVIVAGLGVVLAAMNTLFYQAIARLPLATVGAIEFLGLVLRQVPTWPELTGIAPDGFSVAFTLAPEELAAIAEVAFRPGAPLPARVVN